MKKVYTYQVVDEQRQDFGHMLYLLRHTTSKNDKIELWVGSTKLKRLYKANKITGQISKHVNYVVGNEPKKSKPKKVKLTPREPKTIEQPKSNWVIEEPKPIGWQIQDEFIAGPIKPDPFKGMFDDIPADENDY